MLVSPGFTLRCFLTWLEQGCVACREEAERLLIDFLPCSSIPPSPQEGPGQALLPGDPGPTVGAEERKDRVRLALVPVRSAPWAGTQKAVCLKWAFHVAADSWYGK